MRQPPRVRSHKPSSPTRTFGRPMRTSANCVPMSVSSCLHAHPGSTRALGSPHAHARHMCTSTNSTPTPAHTLANSTPASTRSTSTSASPTPAPQSTRPTSTSASSMHTLALPMCMLTQAPRAHSPTPRARLPKRQRSPLCAFTPACPCARPPNRQCQPALARQLSGHRSAPSPYTSLTRMLLIPHAAAPPARAPHSMPVFRNLL
ncbi:hypothetical protein FIBSPDRAFT_962625 [Athelia psychrophila]|uniref:Uncharacterized protein n=1 Tax=Athelia psychrophila TaxID=1759441 RepID=A0A165ZYN0_9AGAM|nr:hypothetical protein FIBSPDRAFT_962625 [Fibularhizoctonia sp. CBS 109695]